MTDTLQIAVAGATSPAGEALIERLAGSGLPVRLTPLARGEPEVGTVPFGTRHLSLRPIEEFDFAGVRLLFLFDAPDADRYAGRARAAGALVIDATGQWAGDPAIPLLGARSGGQALAAAVAAGRAALADPIALHASAVLAPIAEAAGILDLSVTALCAVSTLGSAGSEALAGETARLLNARPLEGKGPFGRQIAFNVLPATGPLAADGNSERESAAAGALKRLLALPNSCAVSALYVPVFFGDSLLYRLTTRDRLPAGEVARLLGGVPGLELTEGGVPTAVTEAAQGEGVYVGRIRSEGPAGGLSLWSVADPNRGVVAGSGVQIAEFLVKDYLLTNT